jgi:hypothetical protein
VVDKLHRGWTEGWSDKLDRGKWCVYSVVQSGVVEVGVDCRSVVSKVEEVSRCVGHVVVGESLGGWECGSRVVDDVLVGRVDIGENLRDSVDQSYWGSRNLTEGGGGLAESVSAPPAHLPPQALACLAGGACLVHNLPAIPANLHNMGEAGG